MNILKTLTFGDLNNPKKVEEFRLEAESHRGLSHGYGDWAGFIVNNNGYAGLYPIYLLKEILEILEVKRIDLIVITDSGDPAEMATYIADCNVQKLNSADASKNTTLNKTVEKLVLPYPKGNPGGVKNLLSDIADRIDEFQAEEAEEVQNIRFGLDAIIEEELYNFRYELWPNWKNYF